MQASAYKSFAHYSYLGIYLPGGGGPALDAIVRQAGREGIGIICIYDPKKDEGYELRLPAKKVNPHPGEVDEFIDKRFSDTNRQALKMWVRT